MNAAHAELIHACTRIGCHIPFWTQGYGGNVSVKDGDTLWIKASGNRLDSLALTEGVAQVRLRAFRSELETLTRPQQPIDVLEAGYAALLERCAERGRPSMETGFHVVFDEKFVFHLHSLPALLMAHEHRRDGERVAGWLRTRWPTGRVHIHGAVCPGILLAHAVQAATDARVHLLENHGMVLAAATIDALFEWRALEVDFCREWNYPVLMQLGAMDHPVPVEAARAVAEGLPPMPLKIYFPDTAVFLAELKHALVEHPDERYVLPNQLWEQNRNLAELWLATVLLHDACPGLAELPETISSVIAALPTETFRRATAGSDEGPGEETDT